MLLHYKYNALMAALKDVAIQPKHEFYRLFCCVIAGIGIMSLAPGWKPLNAEHQSIPQQGEKQQLKVTESGLAASVWPKSRSDLGNTGRSVGRGATGKLRWKEKIHFGSDPVIGTDGLVYVGSDNNMIFVLDGVTGVIASRFSPVLASPDPGDGFNTPAIGRDGTIYAGSTKIFYAFDGQSEAMKWQFPAGYALFSSRP